MVHRCHSCTVICGAVGRAEKQSEAVVEMVLPKEVSQAKLRSIATSVVVKVTATGTDVEKGLSAAST